VSVVGFHTYHVKLSRTCFGGREHATVKSSSIDNVGRRNRFSSGANVGRKRRGHSDRPKRGGRTRLDRHHNQCRDGRNAFDGDSRVGRLSLSASSAGRL